MKKYKLINGSLYNNKMIYKLANIIGKRVSSILLAGTLLFTGCSNAFAKTSISSNSMNVACVMVDTYGSSKVPTNNLTPSITIVPSPTVGVEPKLCTEFYTVEVKINNVSIVTGKINGEEKQFFVRNYIEEDDLLLIDWFSFNNLFIEEYNKKTKRIELLPIGIMEGKKIESPERDTLEVYLLNKGMRQAAVMVELSKINDVKDLSKLYMKIVPKEKQCILPSIDEYEKSISSNNNKETSKIKKLV